MRQRPRPFVSLLVLLGSGLLLLLVAVHLSAIHFLRYQLEQALHPQPGQGTYVGDLHLNLFTGTAAIAGIELGPRDDPWFRLAHLSADIDVAELLGGRLVIDRVDALAGYWRVTRDAEGGIDTGLPAFDGGAADETQGGALPVQLRHASLRRFDLLYRDRNLHDAERLRVDEFAVEDVRVPFAAAMPFRLKLDWDAASLTADGAVQAHDGLAVDAEIAVARLPLARTLRLARQPLDLDGSLDSSLKLALKNERVQIDGSLGLTGASYQDAALSASLDRLDSRWQLSLDAGRATLRGDLGLASIAYRDPARALQLAQLKIPGLHLQLPVEDPSALRVRGGALGLQRLVFDQDATSLRLERADADGDWQVDLGGAAFTLEQVQLRLVQLALEQAGSRATVGTAEAQLQADASPFDAPALRGGLQLDALAVSAPPLGGERLEMAGLSVGGLAVGGAQAAFDRVELHQLALGDDRLTLKSADLASSRLSAQRIELGELRLDSLQTAVVRDATGTWQLPVAAQRSDSAADAVGGDTAPEGVGGGPSLRLAGVQLLGDTRVHVEDRAVEPPLVRDLRVETFSLGELDNSRPDADTRLATVLRPDDYTVFKLDGRLRPFSEQFYIDIAGELSNLELALVNGMVADALGHRFVEGHLDNRFGLHIERQQLKMSNALRLQDLAVEAIEGKEGPPLSTAIALLEDKQGRIELDVPVEGDLGNPDFQVMGALNPIIFKAVAGTAALAFQPFGSVLLLGGLLADQALAVSFEPARFEPKTANLAPGVADQLKDLGSKLKEKPKLQLRLCGLAVEADRSRNKKGEYLETEQQLLALADSRAAAARQAMLAAGVAESQLRSCRPKLEAAADAQPRVEIKL